MNIFKKGAFSYDPNMTPQQLADKRAMLAMLQPKYGKASYIGEGLGQLATGVATGIRTRKLDEIEGKGREQGANLFSGLFGGTTQSTSGQSGPMNILGVDPGYGGASSAPPGSPGHTANDGHDHSDWLKYTNQGATRNQPIKPELVSAMSFLPELGLTMEVYSGGQPGIGDGGARVGSTRHDHGGAADVMFRDATGRMLDWNNPDDLPVLTEIVRRAKAAGVTGIGAGDDYMGAGRMHIGFGDPGVWGAGGKGANAPDWLRAAYEGGGLPGGPVAAPAGASTATNSAIPSIDPQALAAALANPWLSPEERSVLTTIYDQQVQAGDPLRQIEVAKGMAELEAMGQPPAPKYDFMQMDDGTLVRTDSAGNIGVVGKYAPDADPEAPQTQTFFDEETGQEYRGQWNPQTGQWERVGGVKALGGDAGERYRAVGGQVWDFKPEGGGAPVLIGGTEEIIYGPDGNPIVVRGASGTAGKMKLTEGQSKDNVFVTRADGALKAFEKGNSGALLSFGESAAGSLPFGVGRYMQGNDYQTAENQGNEFLQAILRKDTGAAITVDEQRLYGDTYLPRPGDGPAVLEAKKLARARAVEAMKSGMDPRQVAMTEQANIAAIARAGDKPRKRYNPATGAFE